MKTQQEIENELDQIEHFWRNTISQKQRMSDDRLISISATVFENARLSLTQFELETKKNVLQWVLDTTKDQ